MAFGDSVTKDIQAAVKFGEGGSPKVLYTTFLLGMVREFFGLILTSKVDEDQIERGFTTLVAFCPDKKERQLIWAEYIRLRDKDGKVSAAINSCGNLIDYLSEALDLTETSEASFL